MTTLRIALTDPIFAGKTADECVDLFEETVEVSRDATPYTWAGTNDQLTKAGIPDEIVGGWDQAIVALPGGKMLDRMLSSGGVDFTQPSIRNALLTVLSSDPAEPIPTVINALLEIGIKSGPRWKKFDLEALPTAIDVSVALSVNAFEQAKETWKLQIDAAFNQIGTSEQAEGIAAFKAIVAEMAGE